MIGISAVAMLNALGHNLPAIRDSLIAKRAAEHALKCQSNYLVPEQAIWLGAIETTLPELPKALLTFNSRNNRLLLAALKQIEVPLRQAICHYGKQRIAIIMGSSTSGIDEGDKALTLSMQCHQLPDEYHYHQQELGDPSAFLAALLGTQGPAYTLSTACTSSARAIISGKRLIEAGLVDAALVGGADSLSRMPINGFKALEALDDAPCQPFALARSGINIGEAAALFLLTREPTTISLLGCGESSDAYHMSAPHPEGIGALQAMQSALSDAQLSPRQLGYINLHGTGTPLNDRAESKAVACLLDNASALDAVLCSSTKHLTGHTLGCSAATELGISYLILQHDLFLPQQSFMRSAYDPALAPLNMVQGPHKLNKKIIMSNSFAFGGNNASLIIGRTDDSLITKER